jgi:Na+-translocating ferredoxin:NAD+ oxidoreductase RnfD subunit
MANEPFQRKRIFYAIATDLHFWIPLGVLLGGLFLLDKLR